MQPGLLWASTDQYAQRIAYVAGQDYEEYIGETHAKNQNKPAINAWRIKKISYDATWRVTSITWANRSIDFNFAWTRRASYNYN